jgi:hypothetical protein
MGDKPTDPPPGEESAFSREVAAKAGRKLRVPGGHSWTLMLLSVGLIIGCINAWHWMVMEDNAMHDESKDKDA